MKRDTLIGFTIMIFLIFIGISLIEKNDVDFDRDVITLPVSVHLVQDGTVQFSTDRKEEDIQRIFEEANKIWYSVPIILYNISHGTSFLIISFSLRMRFLPVESFSKREKKEERERKNNR